MRNCFFCDFAPCSQAGIDGMWGDGCVMDNDRVVSAAELPAPIETAVPPESGTQRRGDAENAEPAAPEGIPPAEDAENAENPSAPLRLRVEREPAPEKDGGALAHCGYEVLTDNPGGRFSMRLSTPFEGASVAAEICPKDDTGRRWDLFCGIGNDRGSGYALSGEVLDAGRHVAKALLRSMALELRKLYCHRSQKCRKRAIARAKAEAVRAAGPSDHLTTHTQPNNPTTDKETR